MTVPEQLRALSAALRQAREGAGMGVREVARAAWVSPGTVRNLEAGMHEPFYRQTARVANALDLRLELSTPGLRRGRPNRFLELQLLRHHFYYPLVAYEPLPASALVDTFCWGVLHVIAAQVWWRRQMTGWSSEHAAQQWGLSPKTLRSLEYGQAWPSVKALAQVAHQLGSTLVLAPSLADWPKMPWQQVRPGPWLPEGGQRTVPPLPHRR